jgi:peptidoglycan/xylan/chitin deacetylase (PgdA/CDA1 family)
MQVESDLIRGKKMQTAHSLGPIRKTSSLKVSMIGFDASEVEAIRILLYPFKIDYVSQSKESDLTISKGMSEPKDVECSKLILVPVLESDNLFGSQGNGVIVLPYDIVSACLEKLERVLHHKISMTYNLSTRLPFDYNIVPSSVRSKLLSSNRGSLDFDLSRHLSIETQRRKLVESFAELGLILERKHPPSFMITHDIDTEKGLERASSLKKIEDDFGISSTWFLVSSQYPISKEIARYLAEGCSEIGSHDTKHDGRLIHLKKQEELVARLSNSRERLEEIFEGKEITSFRAPLLQFNSRIISALAKSGYKSDFSLPTWEAVHPSTMQGFGIESASEFELSGIVEHPLTLFQDHQVLEVLGMSTSKAVKFWMDQISLIRAYDGDVVLLVHPDYSFSEDLESYRKLIESISLLKEQEKVNVLAHASTS